MEATVEQHLALLLSDGLRFTKEITDERRQDLIETLDLIALGETNEQSLHDTLRLMLDHRWTLTAPFSPEFAEAFREATGAGQSKGETS